MPTTSGAHVIFRNKNSFALAIHRALLFVGSHAFSESLLLPVRTTLSLSSEPWRRWPARSKLAEWLCAVYSAARPRRRVYVD
jgi:hypothetical protein